MKKVISLILAAAFVFVIIPVFEQSAYAAGDRSSTVSLGYHHAAVIKSDGSLWMWGTNHMGELGDGTVDTSPDKAVYNKNVDKASPIKVMDDVTSVSLGANHTLAIKSDGSLWAWGWNMFGAIGDGTTDNVRNKPVKIMDGVVSCSAGSEFSAAVKSDGSLWMWGANSFGMLGDGTTENRLKPVKIMNDVLSVSAGDNHTAAITKDGSLWVWGEGISGQIGDGLEENTLVPVKALDDVVSVNVTGGFTYDSGDKLYGITAAIKKDGSLWIWGCNSGMFYSGILGLGSEKASENKNVPTKLMDNVKQVALCSEHAAVVKNDGSLWTWGWNLMGELGSGKSGSGTGSNVPVKVMDSGVSAAAAGLQFTAIIKNDGSLWTCGNNEIGQLGDGTTKNRASFTKILDNAKLPTQAPAPDISADKDRVPATPTTSTVKIDSNTPVFNAYNINGNNYFKLRELAYWMNNTEKRFSVEWDGKNNAIILTSGRWYEEDGSEFKETRGFKLYATPTTSKVMLDGKEIKLTAYNIDGNNYFKLRDIGQAFDFGVAWDGATNTIIVNTGIGYTP